MKRLSPNSAAVVLIAAFVTLGMARLLKDQMDGHLPRVKLRASISHPMLLGGQTQTAYIKIDLTGFEIEVEQERTPVNVAFVLDKSGSMGGEKMAQAIDATVMAVDYLQPSDVVSVVVYDNDARVVVPATAVGDKSAIKDQIRSIRSGGGTALYAGVVLGARELREFLDPGRFNRVILLSDGQANEGPSSPRELGDLGASLIHEGISVTTIGLGLGYNEDLMTQLALRSDGNHSFVEHSEDLASVFDREFGDVLSVVAQDVAVKIQCGDNIRPIRVMGRPADIDGQSVTVAFNQLYSAQDKYIMLEVETKPSVDVGEIEVADVSMSYANMVTRETDKLSTRISATVTQSERDVEANIAPEPMSAAVIQNGILNEERAIELRDEGKIEEAQELLKENAAYYKVNADRFDDDRLREGAEKSRQAAEGMESESWTQQRKAMRSDHYQSKVQQGGN